MTSIEIPGLFTDAEVAERLSVCEATVARLRRSRKIGWTRIAGSPRITVEHIAEYIKSQEIQPLCRDATSNSAKKTGYGTSGSTTQTLAPQATLARVREITERRKKG